MVVGRGWGVGNRERLVKGYKLSVTRRISAGDLMYSMVTIATNNVLYT